MVGSDELRMSQVLHGLSFPAPKWRILTQADLYGADGVTRQLLHGLPVREYHSCADVAAALRPRPARHAPPLGGAPVLAEPGVRGHRSHPVSAHRLAVGS